MNNENMLGIHANLQELGEVGISLLDEEARQELINKEEEAWRRCQKAVVEIHSEGREFQEKWKELLFWMAFSGEDMPREIIWGLDLYDWKQKKDQKPQDYWQKIFGGFSEEQIPRELRWGYALFGWRSKVGEQLAKLRTICGS